MLSRVLISALVVSVAGCISAPVQYAEPPARHVSPEARRMVARMAISVNRVSVENMELLGEVKYSVHHVVSSASATGSTLYCIVAPMPPRVLGKPVDLPVMMYYRASVRINDGADGKMHTLAINSGNCPEDETKPFPELKQVAAAMAEYNRNRPPPPPPPEK